MEKYIDVMKRTIELSVTCLEGLEHIKVKLNEGRFEETIQLMNDVVTAFSKMESSIQPIFHTLPSNEIQPLTHSLINAFENAVTAYEQGQAGKVKEIFQFTLLPAYKKWKVEVEKVFHPYLIS
ncbi:hypothetical protein [Ammoniphilus resinae]|uniref:DUF8042 domain-containing protein n=1 Tax=Ammoniphilus resinae TaxID=861532 RepID=A0ABS4GMH3_9BACL|nr:hypothetical protein [Ammoniphilus resinae]MBP1931459.1 hypothetical protein [Ammoniphilus resinae]